MQHEFVCVTELGTVDTQRIAASSMHKADGTGDSKVGYSDVLF